MININSIKNREGFWGFGTTRTERSTCKNSYVLLPKTPKPLKRELIIISLVLLLTELRPSLLLMLVQALQFLTQRFP